jgi:hypothetical protein
MPRSSPVCRVMPNTIHTYSNGVDVEKDNKWARRRPIGRSLANQRGVRRPGPAKGPVTSQCPDIFGRTRRNGDVNRGTSQGSKAHDREQGLPTQHNNATACRGGFPRNSEPISCRARFFADGFRFWRLPKNKGIWRMSRHAGKSTWELPGNCYRSLSVLRCVVLLLAKAAIVSSA